MSELLVIGKGQNSMILCHSGNDDIAMISFEKDHRRHRIPLLSPNCPGLGYRGVISLGALQDDEVVPRSISHTRTDVTRTRTFSGAKKGRPSRLAGSPIFTINNICCFPSDVRHEGW